MTIPRIVSTTVFCAALASGVHAQPLGPGPIGPGPIGPGPMGLGPIGPGPSPSAVFALRPGPRGLEADDRADELYSEGRELIEEGKYDRAVERFNRLIDLKSNRTDAALYWKAYSLNKLGQRAEAMTALTDLQKQFGDSRWLRDAKALEVEVRSASGQTVAPDPNDEELKLLALRAIMQNDPDQAIPIIEKMLSGTNSPKATDRAL